MNLLLAGALTVLLLAASSVGVEAQGEAEVEAEVDAARRVLIASSCHIDEGQLPGPESIAFDRQGFLYTGVGDGTIRRINPFDYTQTVYAYDVKLADRSFCGSANNRTAEATCGRPLGLKFDRHDNLYVADAYYGLLFVPRANPANVVVLANSSEGVPFGFTNGLVINKAEDTIYLTDTSPTDTRFDFLKVFLEAKPQGRLVRYNIRTGKTTTLLSDLVFGNGVAFNDNEKQVIINETSLKRVRRYYVSGPKAGQNDLFNSDVGGYPDNVQFDPLSGYFLLGCYSEAPSNTTTTPAPGFIVALDCSGAVRRTLYDPTGLNVIRASEANRRGDKIYVGSVGNPYLTTIPANLLTQRN